MSDSLTRLSPSDLFPYLMERSAGGLSSPHAREVYLFTTHVAGPGYVEGIAEIVSELRSGAPIALRRQPDNPYDALAIAVYDRKRRRMGYVPRSINAIPARLMDAGFVLFGRLKSTDGDEAWPELMVDIFLEAL